LTAGGTDNRKKRLTVGLLAHVDAGKTTLSEAMLYTAGALRKLGRVDHGDAFLDTQFLGGRHADRVQMMMELENP
jgi:translation elongation factor EF-G